MSFQQRKWENRVRNETPNVLRRRILSSNFFRRVYAVTIERLLEEIDYREDDGLWVELGSAGGITDLLFPNVLTTDIRSAEGVCEIVSADEKLRFENNSVSGFFAKDVLHHLPNPMKHFEEVLRCLKPGGRIAYAEPNWNRVSQTVFTLFHPEPFRKNAPGWKMKSDDPMYSNQAIPYIIFKKELIFFEELFPEFSVYVDPSPALGISFLLSGGVMSRTPIPDNFLIKLAKLEARIPILLKLTGVQRYIVLTKITDSEFFSNS
jgi:SAM-dependent methyltransferase